MGHDLLSQEELLGFQVLAIINWAAVNILVHTCWHKHVTLSVGLYQITSAVSYRKQWLALVYMIKTLSPQAKPKVRQAPGSAGSWTQWGLKATGPFVPCTHALCGPRLAAQIPCRHIWPDNIQEKNETIAFSMSFPEDALAFPVTHSETTHGPVMDCILRGQLSYLLKG